MLFLAQDGWDYWDTQLVVQYLEGYYVDIANVRDNVAANTAQTNAVYVLVLTLLMLELVRAGVWIYFRVTGARRNMLRGGNG